MESPPSSSSLTADHAAGQVLLDGLSDWVDLGMVRQYVRDEEPSAGPDELRDSTLDLVAWLLQDGLVVAGDVGEDFVAWDVGTRESIAAIRTGWTDPGAPLHPGDVCWFATTEAGDEIGRNIYERDVLPRRGQGT